MTQMVAFVVDDEPYGLWDLNIRERNLLFINNLDPDYFTYLAKLHGEQLDNEPQRAAIALRTAYHHGLESFFGLLFATLQAPACVFAWLQKYRLGQLRRLVQRVQFAQPIRNRHRLNPVTWEGLSRLVNLGQGDDPRSQAETQAPFAELWQRFAIDFLDANHTNEYNSIKHGLRTRSGGFTLAVALQTAPGIEPPRENMEVLGGSEFGTSYFVAEPIPPSDRHFRVRRHALNWSPHAMARGLQLISYSLNNIVSYLKMVHGVPGRDVVFHRPAEADDFESPWAYDVGVTHSTFDAGFDYDAVQLFSKEELLALYDKPRGSDAATREKTT